MRNQALDILKIILAFMVVGIHGNFYGDINWEIRNYLANGIFRLAVPTFFLISGYFFFSKLHLSSRSWFIHLIVIYLVWMTIYHDHWYWHGFGHWRSNMRHLLLGHHHLWYLASLIGCGVLLLLVHKIKSVYLMVLITLLYSVGLAMQYAAVYEIVEHEKWKKIVNDLWFYRSTPLFAFPFFVGGYLLAKHNMVEKIKLLPAGSVALFGLLALFTESYINHMYLTGWKGFDLLITFVIVCPALVVFALKLNIPSQTKTLGLYATGIYLVHPLFLQLLYDDTDYDSTKRVIVAFILSWFVSGVLIKINKKIKVFL